MKAWLPKAERVDRDALVALAELPLQIRGFGPVKRKSEQQAAKRREELLIALKQGPDALKSAAE